MKKIVFICITIIVSAFLLVTIPNISYADYGIDPSSYDPGNSGEIDAKLVGDIVGKIYNILFQISIVISVISLSVIGLSYIVGSVEEKAEYKKKLIPVALGIFIVSTIVTIVSTLAKIANVF